MNLESELEAIVSSTRELFAAAACSCALASADGSSLTFVAASGAGAAQIVGVSLPVSRGIAGYVALSGQPIAVADVARDDRFARDIAEISSYVPKAILAVPMVDPAGETIGVMEVLDASHGEGEARLGANRGTVAELATLTVVASQAAIVIRLARDSDPVMDRLAAALSSLDDLAAQAVVELLTALAERVESGR